MRIDGPEYDAWKLQTPWHNEKEVDYNTIEIDGIDTNDYPDFCDAYISYAEFEDGTALNDNQLDALNEDGDLVHEKVYESLY